MVEEMKEEKTITEWSNQIMYGNDDKMTLEEAVLVMDFRESKYKIEYYVRLLSQAIEDKDK